MKKQNKYAVWVRHNTIWIILTVGYIVKSVWLVIDHHLHPEKFADLAAPWFLRMIIEGAGLLVGILIAKVIIAILNKRGK